MKKVPGTLSACILAAWAVSANGSLCQGAEAPPAPGAVRVLAETSGLFSLAIPANWGGGEGKGFVFAQTPGRQDATVTVCSEPAGAAPAALAQQELQAIRSLHRDAVATQGTATIAGRQAVVVHYESNDLFGEGVRAVVLHDKIWLDSGRHLVKVELSIQKSAAPQVQAAARQVLASLKLGTDAPQPGPSAPPQGAPPPQPAAGAVRAVAEPSGLFSVSVPADWQTLVGPGYVVATAPENLVNFGISAEPKGLQTAQQKAQAEVKSSQETAQSVKNSVPYAQFRITQGTAQVAGRPAFSVHEECDMGAADALRSVTDWLYLETDRHVVSIVLCVQRRAPAQVAEAARRILPSLKFGGGTGNSNQATP